MELLRGMAIYHLHSSYGSRQGGQSARAELLYVLRRGPFADGCDKLIASDWGHLPQWCGGDDPFPLFARADRHERANGRLYCELEGALPAELDLEQCIELTRAVAGAVTANGLPYAWGIHEGRPPAPGKPRNRHWHLMYLERIEDGIAREPVAWFRRANGRNPAAGGAAKDRSLKGHEWLPNTRRLYERMLNEALERADCPARVTCESHRTRMARAEADGDHETGEYLLRHPPGLHIGPRACAIERGSPSRTGRTTERGNRARAREAEAQVLRAELERVKQELKDLNAEDRLAAEAAARDARVDVAAVVDAVGSSDTDQAIALLAAAEEHRGEIRREARVAGLGDDAIYRIRRTAEPDDPDLGWAAVVEATAVRRERREAAEAEARGVGVGVDAAYRQARERNEDELELLERETADWKQLATLAGFYDDAIGPIRREAESTRLGSECVAVAKATEERVKQKEQAEADAGRLSVDVDAVYADAQEHGQDPVAALERANAKREEQRRIEAAKEEEVRRDLDRREEGLRSMSTGTRHMSAAARELFGEEEQARTLADRESMIGEAERRAEEELRGREEELRSIPQGTQYLAEAARALLGGAERSRTLAERESMVVTAEQRLASELDGREVRLMESGGTHELLAQAYSEVCADDTFGDGPSLSERSQIITLAEQWHEEDLATDGAWSANLDRAEEELCATSIGADHLNAAQQEVVDAGQDPSSLETRETVVNMARGRVEEALDDREAAVRDTKQGPAWLIAAQRQVVTEDGREPPTLEVRERAIETVEEQIRTDLDRRRKSIVATDDGYRLWSKARQQREDNAIPPTLAEEEQQVDQVEDQLREHRAAERRAARLREERQRQKLASRVCAIRATSGGSQLLEAERRARFGTTTRLRVDEETSIVEAVDLQITEDLDRREAKIAAHAGGEALLCAVRERRSRAVSFVNLAEREQTVVAVEQNLRAADELEALLPTTAPDPERRPDYLVPAVSDGVLKEAVTADDPLFVQDAVFVLRERYAQWARKPAAEGGYDAPAREESQRRQLGDRLAGALKWWVLKIRELILTACDLILGGHGDVGERVQTLARETYEEPGGGDPGGGGPDPARAATRQAMREHHGVMKPGAGEGTGAERPAPPKGQPTQGLDRNRSRQGR